VREVARLATESMARMPQTTDLTEGQPSTEVTPLEPAQ
jgi:hypothetical protein